MAQNTTITLSAQTWTLLTDANVTTLTFQNQSDDYLFVKGTTDTTIPTNFAGAVRYRPTEGERNVALADLFPGISAVRLWGYIRDGGDALVSHA